MATIHAANDRMRDVVNEYAMTPERTPTTKLIDVAIRFTEVRLAKGIN